MSAGKRKKCDPHTDETVWHPDLNGIVTHNCILGNPDPPVPVAAGLAFDASSGSCEPLPHNVPISGTLALCDVPDSHLDYTIELMVGEPLENDLVEKPWPHFRRFVTVMDIYETFVPESHRGQNLGLKLAHAAFSLAASRRWAVRPTCTFISDVFVPRSYAPDFPFKQVRVYTGSAPDTCVEELLHHHQLVLFSSLSNGPHSFNERRRKLSKKSVKQLAEVIEKLPSQSRGRVGATKSAPSKPLLVERVLRAHFCEPTGFYRWKDSAAQPAKKERRH